MSYVPEKKTSTKIYFNYILQIVCFCQPVALETDANTKQRGEVGERVKERGKKIPLWGKKNFGTRQWLCHS